MYSAERLIRELHLLPHPEGGFYRETYRSALSLENLPSPFTGTRQAATAIYFLLTEGTASQFHRIRSDEIWHFHLGGPLVIVEIDPASGQASETILGPDLAAGQSLQHVVPAGRWFGAFPAPGTPWALVGCTVAPGFDFADFEMAAGSSFRDRFPVAERYAKLIPGCAHGAAPVATCAPPHA